jgi:hypothetical protein
VTAQRAAARPGSLARAMVVAFAGTSLAIAVAAIAFVLIPPRPGAPGPDVTGLQIVADLFFLAVSSLIGGFLAYRRPDNIIGWLQINVPFWLAMGFAIDGFARHAGPDMLTGWIVTVVSALGNVGFLSLLLMVQRFPSGHVPGPRWHALTAVTLVGWLLLTVSGLLDIEPVRPVIADLPLPLAHVVDAAVVDGLSIAGSAGLLLALIGSLVLVTIRFRASRGVERQQFKWFGWAAIVVVALLLASIATAPLGAISDTLWNLLFPALVLLPLSAAVAVLRYRLWDIDRIMSRTIAYAIVTALLAGAFLTVVLAIQTLLASLTQAGTVAVAASTLVVFLLFQPLRRRIQGLVDRRFDRARVDADLIARDVAERLRDQVDLATIAATTSDAVDRAMHPQFTRIWLRGEAIDGALRNESRTQEA